jgi:hypothetical protein
MSPSRIVRRATALCALALLAACATRGPLLPAEPELAACVQRFVAADRDTAAAGLADEGEARVPGFPYLRADRLLASFAAEVEDEARFAAWVEALAALDHTARGAEQWNAAQMDALAVVMELNACRARLVAHDRATPARRAALREAVHVADDYVGAWRAAGLYPLSSLFTAAGIRRWHREAAMTFAQPLEALPVRGTLQRWGGDSAPLPRAQAALRLLADSRDALGIPRPGREEAARLFAAYAPVWELDVVDDNDRIGLPYRTPAGVAFDAARAVEYRLLSHTRWQGEVLLQLNYVVWFAARPGKDMYAGALDGLIWRVTLDPDGVPLAYDSIHSCGCYHQFFMTPAMRLRADLPRHGFEPPLLPQPAPVAGRVVVRLASGTHFIERVYADDGARAVHTLAALEYAALRRAPSGSTGPGLFGPYGLVPGSERGERFLLWPMGIRSPGAMRQWGRHATAFVGRRHFDDAFLLEQLFVAGER